MSKRKDEQRKSHGNKATMTQPQPEFIDIPSRPSVPERAAREGVRKKRGHMPPVNDSAANCAPAPMEFVSTKDL